jgi:PAS domain S-box-containing protein
MRMNEETFPSTGSTRPVHQALRDTEESFRLLVSSVQDYAIFMLDPDGCVATWNLGAQRIKGYSAADIIGQHFSAFYTEEDLLQGMPAHELTVAAAEGRFEAEGWRVRQDGSRFWAHIVLTRLTGDDGALRGFAKVTRDVSARREKEEERFRKVVEYAPSAMVMINNAGLIELVNREAEQLFQYSRNELLGQSIELLLPQRFRQAHPQLRTDFFAHPQPRPTGVRRDLYGRRKDGSEFAAEIGLNPIDTAQGQMVLSAIVDISDRKSKEQSIQAALQEKNILLGEIHHRVKNNLQIVHSLLDLQATRIDDPLVLAMLLETQNRIQAMSLIHQTLYQSQDFSKVDFNHFLASLTSMLMSSYGINRSRIALTFDAADIQLPLNKAIPCGLAINELITNAFKHGFSGERSGTIDIQLRAADVDRVVLTVSDDGIGIPADLDLENCSSLGLKLVSLLAEQLGGALNVQRANPTSFELNFPIN